MPNVAGITTESRDNISGGKDLYMNGIFIQGGVRNLNERVYPIQEITRAVESLRTKLSEGYTVLGEADHPDDLNINIDRVSHMITEMTMQGGDGIGKLKLLPTPMGEICKVLLESGVKLGVSSRGSGNVDGNGNVTEFEIVTVDIVANPSAPDAYPETIYERFMNTKRQANIWDVATSMKHDPAAQKHLKNEMLTFITTDMRKK